MTVALWTKMEARLKEALADLPPHSPLRGLFKVLLSDVALGKLQAQRGDGGDELNKSGARPMRPVAWIGLPIDGIAQNSMIEATRDRQAEAARFAKRSSARRFQAPAHLRGKRVRLADGRQISIPDHGFISVDPHPALADDVHDKLRSQGFRECEEAAGMGDPADVGGKETLDALKRSMRSPMYGDRALIGFLNRNAGA